MKLSNLNYRIFLEYIQTYKMSAGAYHTQVLKLGSSFNESSSQDKKIWLELMRYLRELEHHMSARQEAAQLIGDHIS